MNVLVIAPHPDDEAIGCGGTILRHRDVGDHVEVLYVTDGEKSGGAEVRIEETRLCSQVLRTQRLHYLHLPDGDVNDGNWNYDGVAGLAAGADRIYIPHMIDSHPDHQFVGRVCRALTPNDGLFEYEVWTPLLKPTEYVDITPYATAKRAAIRCYKSQLQNGFDEAILALNHYRGLLNYGGSGVMYAEAFTRV